MISYPKVWFFDFHLPFGFFLLGIGQKVFSANNLSVFLYQSSKSFRDFSPIDMPVFLHHLLLKFGAFSPTLIIFRHACQNSRFRKEAIVMMWSPDMANNSIWAILKSHDSAHHKRRYLLTNKLRSISVLHLILDLLLMSSCWHFPLRKKFLAFWRQRALTIKDSW